MENFECNRIEDLLFNASFVKWIRNDASADHEFWERWEAANIDRKEMIGEAKAIILALPVRFLALPKEEMDQEITAILQYCEPALVGVAAVPEIRRKNVVLHALSKWYAVAAAVFILAVASWLLFFPSSSHKDTYGVFAGAGEMGLMVQSNNTGAVKMIQMPDGSSVLLEDGSTLTWHKDFLGNRDVYLEGEAFFEVSKSAVAPFVVYTRYMVTKVLGTSFRVKAWQKDRKGSVAVTTGKVCVFKKENFKKPQLPTQELSGIVVAPNQQAVFNDDSNNFEKSLVSRPLPVEQPALKDFVFEAAPVTEVFRRLHMVYDIDIIYDEQMLAACTLTAAMGKESFYEKLNLVCTAIGATYEIIDGKIIISSKGCK